MKTTTIPGSSVDHTHNQNAACRRQVPACNFFSLNPGPGWQKRLIGSLGVLLGLAFAVLATREVKSDDNLQLDDYGLEGTWINTVNPILPPGVPPVTFRTYITFTGGGASIGSDPTRPLASPQHGTWVRIQGHEYAGTFVQDLFDQAGTFVGTFKGRTRTLLVGKNEYVGVAQVEQRDASGNLVRDVCARLRGVRLVVEPLAPPCEELEPGM